MTIGVITLLIDLVVILLGWPVFGDVDSVLYGVASTGVSTIVIDKILYGIGAGTLAIIVTGKGRKVAVRIGETAKRGTTLIYARGGYTGANLEVLLCACSKAEAYLVKSAVAETDKEAFLMFTETSEVFGKDSAKESGNGSSLILTGERKTYGKSAACEVLQNVRLCRTIKCNEYRNGGRIMAKDMIHAEKLIYEYDKRDEEGNVIGAERAIDGVDIDVPQGSFVAILGHNGSGKSTLAKHMNAILVPTGGTMWVDGRDTKDPAELWNVRQTAGMVFQNPDNQIIGTVVEEDVGFGPENLGVPTDEIWKRVEESLKAVGMLERRKDSPNKLSGGQKQRVAIAGVLAMEPKCIVLDEPTAMLDPNGRKEVIRAVEELRKKKHVTVILITHYMEEVIDADQVFVMDDGHIVMHGTPREIFSQVDELKAYRMDVPPGDNAGGRAEKPRPGSSAGDFKKRRIGGGIMSIALEHVSYVYSPEQHMRSMLSRM